MAVSNIAVHNILRLHLDRIQFLLVTYFIMAVTLTNVCNHLGAGS